MPPDAMLEFCRTAITDWIVRAGLTGASELDILGGVCERLREAGVALWRGSVANDLLDAMYDGCGMRWLRDRGPVEEVFARSEEGFVSDDWSRSPFRLLMESGKPFLRRRLDASHRRGDLPLLDRFQDQGATDYVAHWTRVGEGVVVGEGQGIVSSWTIDAPGGFADGQLELIEGVIPTLALALMLRTSHRAARTTTATYLGSDAADRVLKGNIVRGRAESIRAVVWYSDLVGFTRISDAAGSHAVLELLNDYAEAQVESIDAHGEHVLKFMGDGILAIFPGEDTVAACARALDAAGDARRRLVSLGRYALKGVARPQEMVTLDPDLDDGRAA